MESNDALNLILDKLIGHPIYLQVSYYPKTLIKSVIIGGAVMWNAPYIITDIGKVGRISLRKNVDESKLLEMLDIIASDEYSILFDPTHAKSLLPLGKYRGKLLCSIEHRVGINRNIHKYIGTEAKNIFNSHLEFLNKLREIARDDK